MRVEANAKHSATVTSLDFQIAGRTRLRPRGAAGRHRGTKLSYPQIPTRPFFRSQKRAVRTLHSLALPSLPHPSLREQVGDDLGRWR